MTASPDEIAYFEQIETRFAQLRGTPLLLSPKDWALVASWRRQEIPLRIVLQTLDAIFKARTESEDGASRAVVSLSYCRRAVEEAFSDWQEAQLGRHEDDEAGEATFGLEAAAANLRLWQDQLAGAAATSALDPAVLAAAGAGLGELIVELQRPGSESLAGLEERLEELEDKLLDGILAAATPNLQETIEAHVDRTLAPLRDRLTARAYESTRLSHLRARVRETYELPHLTLYQV